MTKKIIILISFLFFYGCDDAPKAEIEDVISERNRLETLTDLRESINSKLYPVSSFEYRNNCLKVGLSIPICEAYYENKLTIIREKAILLIADQTNRFDSIIVSFKIKEAPEDELPVLYDRALVNKVTDFYSKNKMYRDFNDFILKNIDGNELAQFSIYLKVLKKVDPKVVKTDDFIQLIYDYIVEVQEGSVTASNRDIIVALKKLIMDGNEWKDFNPTDIDFFLSYKQ